MELSSTLTGLSCVRQESSGSRGVWDRFYHLQHCKNHNGVFANIFLTKYMMLTFLKPMSVALPCRAASHTPLHLQRCCNSFRKSHNDQCSTDGPGDMHRPYPAELSTPREEGVWRSQNAINIMPLCVCACVVCYHGGQKAFQGGTAEGSDSGYLHRHSGADNVCGHPACAQNICVVASPQRPASGGRHCTWGNLMTWSAKRPVCVCVCVCVVSPMQGIKVWSCKKIN